MNRTSLIVFVFLRYSSKYRDTKNRLRELGLLDSTFTGSIFTLDDWEIPREKLILNRKLGEGAFGAVFGGEGLELMGSHVSVPVAVKTLRVGATIEDKVCIFLYKNRACLPNINKDFICDQEYMMVGRPKASYIL